MQEIPHRPPVYAYFEEIPGIKPDTQLLDCWRRTWQHFGWEPLELSRAMLEVNAPEYLKRVQESPELGRGNLPEGYARATHLRWGLMAQLGGLIVDYDVMNNGFTPAMLELEKHKHDLQRPIFLNACPCCCAVYATPDAANRMVERILQHAEEAETWAGTHRDGSAPPWMQPPGELSFVCHDQAIFERFQGDWAYPEFSYVREFSTDNWQNALLIHFCNAKTKSPRGKVVRACGLRGLK